eukprot:2705955-Pleurochrysis_carterae.AAC.1
MPQTLHVLRTARAQHGAPCLSRRDESGVSFKDQAINLARAQRRRFARAHLRAAELERWSKWKAEC